MNYCPHEVVGLFLRVLFGFLFQIELTELLFLFSLGSRFVYPAVVMLIIATITFPKGFGQFMAGEVNDTVIL